MSAGPSKGTAWKEALSTCSRMAWVSYWLTRQPNVVKAILVLRKVSIVFPFGSRRSGKKEKVKRSLDHQHLGIGGELIHEMKPELGLEFGVPFDWKGPFGPD